MHPIHLTREQIKKLVFDIESLDQKQRPMIAEMLGELAHSSDGHISPEELRKALSKLRHAYKISEIDARAITDAVFPS